MAKISRKYSAEESCRAVIRQCFDDMQRDEVFAEECLALRERLFIPNDLNPNDDGRDLKGHTIGIKECLIVAGEAELEPKVSGWLEACGSREDFRDIERLMSKAIQYYSLPPTARSHIRAFILYREWPNFVPELDFDLNLSDSVLTEPPKSLFGKALYRKLWRSMIGAKARGRLTSEQVYELGVVVGFQARPKVKLRRRRSRPLTNVIAKRFPASEKQIVTIYDPDSNVFVEEMTTSRSMANELLDRNMSKADEARAANRVRKIRSRLSQKKFKK